MSLFLLTNFISAQSVISDVQCSNNGTFNTAADDFVAFKLNPQPPGGIVVHPFKYNISATYLGNPVTITDMAGVAVTQGNYGENPYYRINNGTIAAAGNIVITLTAQFGAMTQEVVNLTNPGTCSTVCTGASTGNKVTYYYENVLLLGQFTPQNATLPKFDEGTSRTLTGVKIDYGFTASGSVYGENLDPNPQTLRIKTEIEPYQFDINTVAHPIASKIIVQTPGYPTSIPVAGAVLVPASGAWPGDDPVVASTLKAMGYYANTWLHSALASGIDPTTNPLWVTQLTGNAGDDDDITVVGNPTFAFNAPSINLTAPLDLNAYKGASTFPIAVDAKGSFTSFGSGGGTITGSARKARYFVKVEYTYDCIAPPANFNCDSKMYLAQNPNTALYNIDSSTNPFTYPMIGSLAGYQYNAIGFNPTDNFIYGIKTFSNNLLRIDANGLITDLGAITGLPAIVSGGTTNYNSGEFDNLGNLYVKHVGSNSALYKVNVTTKTATLITLSQPTDPSDLAYNLVTGLLYGVNSDGRLFSINPANGSVSFIGTSPGAATFGGLFGSSTGEIYGINNAGGFYQFNLTTGERTLISSAPASTNNDGAHCVTAPIAFDADLSVTKTDNTATYTPGTNTVYTIIVKNNGPFGVVNASVTDNVPAGITAANVSYTAVASAGSSTSVTGTQTGAITDLVSLPVNGTVTYTVTVAIPASFTGNLVNTVTVTPPVNSTDPNMSNNTATDTNTSGACYNPAYTPGTGPDTKLGITLLKRAGAGNADNWPMVRKSGHIALESNTKGFVVTRIAKADLGNITSPQEGMMVYDTTDKCLKIYADGVWACFSNPACP